MNGGKSSRAAPRSAPSAGNHRSFFSRHDARLNGPVVALHRSDHVFLASSVQNVDSWHKAGHDELASIGEGQWICRLV